MAVIVVNIIAYFRYIDIIIIIIIIIRHIRKLWKVIITFVMPVRPSVRFCMYETTRLPLDSFREIWYFSILLKFVEKLQVWLKCDKNNGYFARRILLFVLCLW